MCKTMKGLVLLGDEKSELREFPIPKPGPGQAVVKVVNSAICGSDVDFCWRMPGDVYAKNIKTGRTPQGTPGLIDGIISGHEAGGYVSQLGEGVDYLKVGDRVSVHHHWGCGHCEFCIAGEEHLCPSKMNMGMTFNGSNAEYILIKADNCMPLPDELTFVDGTFIACVGATAFSAMHKLQPNGLDFVGVYGIGPVGLSACLIAKAMGARVIAFDRSAYRIEFAKKVGVDYAINTGDTPDLKEEIMRITHGRGINKSVETTGAPVLREMSAVLAADKGSIVILGAGDNYIDPDRKAMLAFETPYVIRKQLTIRGSYVMPKSLYYTFVRFLVENKVDFGVLVTHHFPLEKAQEAFELARSANCGRIVFDL